MRRANEARRLLALVEAATDVVDRWDAKDRQALRKALGPYPLKTMREGAAYYDKIDAQRRAEVDQVETGKRAFEELPLAPPRMQCATEVARNMGRWTDFGRCDNVGQYVVFDRAAKLERVACRQHALKFVTNGRPSMSGWSKRPTHESWYRIKGFCMEPGPPGTFCKVKVEIGTGKHPGKEHVFA